MHVLYKADIGLYRTTIELSVTRSTYSQNGYVDLHIYSTLTLQHCTCNGDRKDHKTDLEYYWIFQLN